MGCGWFWFSFSFSISALSLSTTPCQSHVSWWSTWQRWLTHSNVAAQKTCLAQEVTGWLFSRLESQKAGKRLKWRGGKLLTCMEIIHNLEKYMWVLSLDKLVMLGRLLDSAECFLYPFLFSFYIRRLEENVKLQLRLLVTQKLDW